ncbi:hypothetical protein PIIN_10929 [Serendipita indica DSM 11827]|uniref:Uncharacterized protein n=1 Tax=Serendipita indica (strain DSM 11827) TaxID=1109443 RepID=G4U053_SERID|nr:hypothetical protein PIIN_10929 [Serendipita indica DSM 11827]
MRLDAADSAHGSNSVMGSRDIMRVDYVLSLDQFKTLTTLALAHHYLDVA